MRTMQFPASIFSAAVTVTRNCRKLSWMTKKTPARKEEQCDGVTTSCIGPAFPLFEGLMAPTQTSALWIYFYSLKCTWRVRLLCLAKDGVSTEWNHGSSLCCQFIWSSTIVLFLSTAAALLAVGGLFQGNVSILTQRSSKYELCLLKIKKHLHFIVRCWGKRVIFSLKSKGEWMLML